MPHSSRGLLGESGFASAVSPLLRLLGIDIVRRVKMRRVKVLCTDIYSLREGGGEVDAEHKGGPPNAAGASASLA